jgi:sterol desaturase/sphingolipid hydroxylase (fatty acid hydroxylase superfamily)
MTSEPIIRLGAYLGVFALMATLEALAPRRRLRTAKGARWLANLSITFLNTILLRLLFPAGAVAFAMAARDRGWGVLNTLDLPVPVEAVLAVIALDAVIYAQHAAFHLQPWLWRLHMMHHADLDIDVTTGARFHPLEILISMGIKAAAIAAIGPSPTAVVAFEVILNALAMFNHSNVALPLAVDRVLRLLVVTPDQHRVHHSVIIREMNGNYGFNLSLWDRLFGTYRAQPVRGHEGMTIGLANYRDPRRLTLPHLLAMPFLAKLPH